MGRSDPLHGLTRQRDVEQVRALLGGGGELLFGSAMQAGGAGGAGLDAASGDWFCGFSLVISLDWPR